LPSVTISLPTHTLHHHPPSLPPLVRQLELQVKNILESITKDEQKKRSLIKGFAVDKAEQLKQVRLIQEKLEAFQTALKKEKLDF
jgi:hypothetical protein